METMIPFNIPAILGTEIGHLQKAVTNRKLSGDGPYTKLCHEWMETQLPVKRALLTTSCTDALEMAAILCGIKAGDEVIAPSYTFVSSVNAFVLRGARIKFVDIRPDTLNIDETLIEAAISPRTRAIMVVHYAGVGCEMDVILKIAKAHRLAIVEDAAQGFLAHYKGRPLGGFGQFGTYSFHETKNFNMGEGGALIVNRSEDTLRAEIIREKGTNRSQYFRGEIDKYSWVDVGSSFLPSELNAAFLYGQLEGADTIHNDRLASWRRYYDNLSELGRRGFIRLPDIPAECDHNGHIFHVRCRDLDERTKFVAFLKMQGVYSVFHYVPLHSSPAGRRYGEFVGQDRYTTAESEKLARLPLYYGIPSETVDRVCEAVRAFFLGPPPATRHP